MAASARAFTSALRSSRAPGERMTGEAKGARGSDSAGLGGERRELFMMRSGSPGGKSDGEGPERHPYLGECLFF